MPMAGHTDDDSGTVTCPHKGRMIRGELTPAGFVAKIVMCGQCNMRFDPAALEIGGEFVAMGRPVTTVVTGEAHPPILNDEPLKAEFPCVYRGDVVRQGECDLCGIRGQPFDIYACAKFGECSVARRNTKVRPCSTCFDRKATSD